MGILCSCCFNPQRPEQTVQRVNERTRLLASRDVSQDDLGVMYRNSKFLNESLESPKEMKTDEQNNQIGSNANKCVDKLGANIIDITAIYQPIDKIEYKRRELMYQRKVAAIKKPLRLRSSLIDRQLLLESALVNEAKPISNEDFEHINYFSANTSLAIQEGFRILCDEPVVVPFMP